VEFKERYLRPNYLQLSFALGALTIGLRVAGANYTFTSTVSLHATCRPEPSCISAAEQGKAICSILVVQQQAAAARQAAAAAAAAALASIRLLLFSRVSDTWEMQDL
jgi:hypothetical protein